MGTTWKMPLAIIGKATGDRRMFDPNSLDHLSLPLPFRYVAEDDGGHKSARVVGTIAKVDYADDGTPTGSGEFFDGEDAPERTRAAAQEALHLVKNRVIGPSVDLDSAESEGRELKEKLTLAEAKDCGCTEHATKQVMAVTKGRIRSATLVQIPAFAELSGKALLDGAGETAGEYAALGDVAAFVTLHEAAEELMGTDLLSPEDVRAEAGYAIDPGVGGGVDRAKLDAGDFVDPDGRRFPIVTPKDVRDAVHLQGRADPPVPEFRAKLTAIAKRKGAEFVAALPRAWDSVTAAGCAPAKPPAEWFDKPEFTGPTPLTITDDGRVFGHVAAWGTCHVGIGDACITPPKSKTNYAYFHTGEMVTASGRKVPVGRLSYGGGHAKHHLGFAATADHYDATSSVGAYVRAGEDEYGIWVAGAMSPLAGDDAYATMRAAPLSGDWRKIGGNLEMVAALHVNTAGFPIPRSVMASGALWSLTAAGALPVPQGPAGPQEHADIAAFLREEFDRIERERWEQAALNAAKARREEAMTAAVGELEDYLWRERVQRRTGALASIMEITG